MLIIILSIIVTYFVYQAGNCFYVPQQLRGRIIYIERARPTRTYTVTRSCSRANVMVTDRGIIMRDVLTFLACYSFPNYVRIREFPLDDIESVEHVEFQYSGGLVRYNCKLTIRESNAAARAYLLHLRDPHCFIQSVQSSRTLHRT